MSPTSYQAALPRVIVQAFAYFILFPFPFFYSFPLNKKRVKMGGEGFEPSKAELTDLQSAPFGHSGIHPYKYLVISYFLALP